MDGRNLLTTSPTGLVGERLYNISGRMLENYRKLALRNQLVITISTSSSFRPNDLAWPRKARLTDDLPTNLELAGHAIGAA
jgi:hypothetical protein